VDILRAPLLEIRKREISKDGTRKYLLELDNGDLIESVMIKQPRRMTLCVSSQVGCAMGCTFCRTASMGLKRNLRASEMVRQIVTVIEDAKNFGDMFQNLVFMGMGEPLHNLSQLLQALRILADDRGLGISGRRVTVSTSGLVPGIDKLAASGVEVNLAVSLNATSDEVRSKLMPINRRYPLRALMEALKRFPLKPRKRFTLEYVLLSGVNDNEADIVRLPRLLHGVRAKINLIPYNTNAGLGYEPPPRERILYWQERLLSKGIETSIRWSRGLDIQAACGQLVSSSKGKKGLPAHAVPVA